MKDLKALGKLSNDSNRSGVAQLMDSMKSITQVSLNLFQIFLFQWSLNKMDATGDLNVFETLLLSQETF